MRAHPASKTGLALAVPLIVFWSSNLGGLRGWWFGDDPCLLSSVAGEGVLWPFFESSGAYFIPMLHLSLGVDWQLFGLHPEPYYWHQYISLSLLDVSLLLWKFDSGVGLRAMG